MRTLHLKILLRAALLVAIVASTALLVDYQSASGPSFCGVGSGCAQVRESSFSHIFGIPLPALGLAGFGLLFVAASWARSRQHLRLLALACGLAALGALGLIGVMVLVIRAVCPWCLGVDIGAISAAILAALLASRAPEPEPNGQRALWTATAVAASVITLLWGRDPEYKPPPEGVAELQVPGKVTLVVFTDFECPFCRALHPVVDEIAEKNSAAVAVRLVMVPLPMHLAAEPTARAYLCADEAHQKAFAHALYTLPYDDMVHAVANEVADAAGISLEKMVERLNASDQATMDSFTRQLEAKVTSAALGEASKVGLDRARIESCMADPATRKQLDEQIDLFRRTKLEGLPSTFVGNYVVQGADEAMLRSAVRAAIEGGNLSVRWMFAILAGLFIAASAISLAARPSKVASAGEGHGKGAQQRAGISDGDDAETGVGAHDDSASAAVRRAGEPERPSPHKHAKKRSSRRPPAAAAERGGDEPGDSTDRSS